MFAKPLKDIEYQDIVDLIEVRKEKEGLHLDFKGEPNPKGFDGFANKMVKIFSSFANSNGGYIIFGVEEIDKKFIIKGVLERYEGKTLVEWLNQKMIGNLEPRIFYPDPKVIPIPDSIDRVLIVYHILESTIKPHFNNGEDRYYVRVNDSSIAARHYQVRDMFESTRRRYDEFNDFLERRNLLDEDSDDFGLTPSSKLVTTDIFTPESNARQPLFLVSFFPKFPNNQIILSHKPDITNWIVQNSTGHEPLVRTSIFSTHKKNYNLHGVVFTSYRNELYIEFQNNGYVETGMCDSIFWTWTPSFGYSKPVFSLDITNCAGYVISMLNFIKKYYNYIGYEDEITIQLSFRNVLGFHISGLNQTKGRREWRSFGDVPTNNTHKNFCIMQKIIPNNLDGEKINEIAKDCAEKIMLACNVNDLTLCFIDDKIDLNHYSQMSRR